MTGYVTVGFKEQPQENEAFFLAARTAVANMRLDVQTMAVDPLNNTFSISAFGDTTRWQILDCLEEEGLFERREAS